MTNFTRYESDHQNNFGIENIKSKFNNEDVGMEEQDE